MPRDSFSRCTAHVLNLRTGERKVSDCFSFTERRQVRSGPRTSVKNILEGIRNGVIKSTVVVDAREAGRLCMKAMEEYMAQRYTNEYFPVTVELIDGSNVDAFESGE